MNADYEKALGQNIRKIRLKRNLSQEQVSAQLQVRGCDITRSALAKIEVGQRHIYPDELKAFKEIFRFPTTNFSCSPFKRYLYSLLLKIPVDGVFFLFYNISIRYIWRCVWSISFWDC